MTIEEILLEVEKEFQMGGLSDGVYADYAREVAKRFAAALEYKNDALQKDAERWHCVRNSIPLGSPYAVWREGSHVVLGKDADDLVDNFLAALKRRVHG